MADEKTLILGIRSHFSGFSRRLAMLRLSVGALVAGAAILFFAPGPSVAAPLAQPSTITGLVFQDFDQDGNRDSGEPPVGGVTVSAYDSTGALAGPPAITDPSGNYSLTVNVAPGTQVRVEFTNLPTGFNPGAFGSDSGTTVVFAQGGQANVDAALANAGSYCQSNPSLATPCYVNGDPLAGGNVGADPWLVAFPDNLRGQLPGAAHSDLALGSDIGSTWGLAYQRTSTSLFAGAMMKRHSGFGPGTGAGASDGTGTIYRLDLTGGIPAPGAGTLPGASIEPYLDLDVIFGAGTTGTNPHQTGTANALSADKTLPSNDPLGWDAVGKISLGDLEMSDDDTTLWVMNLADKRVYAIDIGVPLKPAGTIGSGDITRYRVPTGGGESPLPAGAPACATGSGDMRPFALSFHQGVVYVGVVCSAENGGTSADLRAYIFQLDPGSGNWSHVFDFSLDFTRGCVSTDGICFAADWLPWTPTMSSLRDPADTGKTSLAFNKQVIYPQPILSDIEIDDDGSLILGFIDRDGHQTGTANYPTQAGRPILVPPEAVPTNFSATETFEGANSGDLIRVCNVGGTYFLEGDPSGNCPQPGAGAGNGQGPNGGEYYHTDNFATHQQNQIGGIAHLAGSGEVVSNNFDPFSIVSGGISWFDNSSGDDQPSGSGRLEIFANTDPTDVSLFGKAAGLGDLEFLCEPSPLEIGNRVWIDTNADGVQDAGEVPVPGITVRLYDLDNGGVLVGTTTTDANGNYIFNDGNVPGGLLFNRNYAIRLDEPNDFLTGPLMSLFLTNANQNPGGADPGVADIRDSDGLAFDLGGGLFGAEIIVQTGLPGQNNHTYDFGFTPEDVPPPTPPPTGDGGGRRGGGGDGGDSDPAAPAVFAPGLPQPLLLPELGYRPVLVPRHLFLRGLAVAMLLGGLALLWVRRSDRE